MTPSWWSRISTAISSCHGVGVDTAVKAVDEVGNPTILATFAVIAALLPMAFVSGLMGPYMRPIPVGASAAMLFSLLMAFIVSPWMSYRVLGKASKSDASRSRKRISTASTRGSSAPLMDSARKRRLALAGVGSLLALAMMLVPLKLVTVKMLPFDNKSELQVIIDMPEGSAWRRRRRWHRRWASTSRPCRR